MCQLSRKNQLTKSVQYMRILEVLLFIREIPDYMTTKLALLGGICALALFLNTACSTTKTASSTTQTSSSDAKVVKTDEKLPAVAEPPPGTQQATTRHGWGNNISPYVN
jgi:hypothetical protein